jgi:hypothetical protein
MIYPRCCEIQQQHAPESAANWASFSVLQLLLRRASIARARLSANPTLPRIGRVQRQCQRCLTIHNPASMTRLKQWCYAGRAHAHWQYEVIREALARLGAKQIGRANGPGRAAIYATCLQHDARNAHK